MSHTDKTDPHWVRAIRHPRRHIEHGHHCENKPSARWVTHKEFRPCVIVETPEARWLTCHWEIPDDEYYSFWYGSHCSREDRRLYWYGGARVEERDKLREAIKDYRANGDIDHVELKHQQHRHDTAWKFD